MTVIIRDAFDASIEHGRKPHCLAGRIFMLTVFTTLAFAALALGYLIYAIAKKLLGFIQVQQSRNGIPVD